MRNRGSIWKRVTVLVIASLMVVVLCAMTAMADGETTEPADPTAEIDNPRHYVIHEGYTDPAWKTVRAKFAVDDVFDPAKARLRVVDVKDETKDSDLFEAEFLPDTGTITGNGQYINLIRIRPKVGATGTSIAYLRLEYDADGDGVYTLLDYRQVSLEVTDKELLTEVGCTVVRPVAGGAVDTTITSLEPEKYTVTLVSISDVYDPDEGITGEGAVYEPNQLYDFRVRFSANNGYRLLEETVYTINGLPTGSYLWGQNPIYYENIYYGRSLSFVTGEEGGEWHSVTVNNGHAYSYVYSDETDMAECGSTINLKADEAPEGWFFDGWTVDSGNADIDDVTKTNAKFVMGDEDVVITANFKELIKYGVWIGGTQITTANMKNIFGDSENPTATASYDEATDTMTVTLRNATLNGICNESAIWSDGINLVLNIEGGLTITMDEQYDQYYYNTIYVEGGADLTINGSLTAESPKGNVIDCDGSVTVTGDLNLTSTYGIVIDVSKDINITGNVTVNNALSHTGAVPAILSTKGNIKISGDVNVMIDKAGGGIRAERGTVTITGNTTISTGSGAAILAKAVVLDGTEHSLKGTSGLIKATDGDVTINGDVTAEMTNSSGSNVSIAIFADKGTVGVTGNMSVTAPMTDSYGISAASIILDGTSYTITAGEGLYASGGDISVRGDLKISSQGRCVNAVNLSSEKIYDVSCEGNLTLTSEAEMGIFANDVDITGNVSIEAENQCINAANSIRIDGNVTATTKGVTMSALKALKVTVVSGTWTLSGTKHAVDAYQNVTIPASHAVVLPEGGRIAEYTDGSSSWQTIVDANGNPVNDAEIAPASFSVTVTDNGYGTAKADIGSGIAGTVVTLTATPKEGYRFKEWNILEGGMGKTDDGAVIPGIFIDANNKFTLETKNVKIEAVFEPLPKYTVTVKADPAEGGSVSGGGSFTEDEYVTVTATPNTGYTFKCWTYPGASNDESDPKIAASENATYTFLASSDTELIAVFEKNATTETATDQPEGGTETTKPAEGGTDTTKPAESSTDTTKPAEGGTETTKPAEGGTDTAKQTEEVKYTIVSGDNGSVTQGSDMTITVKRSVADETCINHFTGVQIDGKACAAGDYEAKAGSTVVTLKAATIQKLSAGTHTVTVLFDDGKAETKLTVKAAAAATDNSGSDKNAGTDKNSGKAGSEDKAVESPKTGDTLTSVFYILAILSGISMCGTSVICRKRRGIRA